MSPAICIRQHQGYQGVTDDYKMAQGKSWNLHEQMFKEIQFEQVSTK